MWYKVKWIPPLFAALDTVAPNRYKGQDGTIGDTAHQSKPSGHNPDDTAGSLPERQDADTKAEVRALDASERLNHPDITMWDVVNAILSDPDDRNRFIYIIYHNSVWRKSEGWVRKSYTGAWHDHLHVSGDPAYDEDGSPFNSILALGEKEVTDTQREINTDQTIFAIGQLHEKAAGVTVDGFSDANHDMALPAVTLLKRVDDTTEATLRVVQQLPAGGVTQEMLNTAVTNALLDEDVLNALGQLIYEKSLEAARQAEDS
jgi:hypothetical protein